MALEEMAEPMPAVIPELVGETSLSPHVDICLTANVRVVHCGARPSDDIPDPKVVIYTTLSAVFHEPVTAEEEVVPIKERKESQSVPGLIKPFTLRSKNQPVVHKSEEVIGHLVETRYRKVIDRSVINESQEVDDKLVIREKEEVFDQPLVHRSQKSTQLNRNAKVKQLSIDKKGRIERMLLLPYFGCTTDMKFIIRSQELMIKSSKSWNKVSESLKENIKSRPFLSKSLHNLHLKNKPSGNKRSDRYKPLNHSFKQQPSLKSTPSSLNDSIRNFSITNDLNSASPLLFIDEGNIKFLCTPIIDSEINETTLFPKPIKSALKRNNTGWEQEIINNCKNIHPKATRNVSILHKPKTRDKETSTTSLDTVIMEQGIDDSIKGLLMPYISAGKDFPSELVLKLIPKKDIETKPIDSSHKSDVSSETDLLTPIINPPPKQKKKREKRSIFTMCFKSKKKGDDDASDSNESLTKEIYYPSIVEVYDKKPRKSPNEVDSEVELTTTNHDNMEDRKKKPSSEV